jgi:hypothetical protein
MQKIAISELSKLNDAMIDHIISTYPPMAKDLMMKVQQVDEEEGSGRGSAWKHKLNA